MVSSKSAFVSCLLLLVLLAPAQLMFAFQLSSSSPSHQRSSSARFSASQPYGDLTTSFSGLTTSSKFSGESFQIEEFEDCQNLISFVKLETNGTITLVQAEGPMYSDSHGSWTYDSTNEQLEMVITKRFSVLREGFDYEVSRKYIAEPEEVLSNTFIMGGNLFDIEHAYSDEDFKIGFFKMIKANALEHITEANALGHTY